MFLLENLILMLLWFFLIPGALYILVPGERLVFYLDRVMCTCILI